MTHLGLPSKQKELDAGFGAIAAIGEASARFVPRYLTLRSSEYTYSAQIGASTCKQVRNTHGNEIIVLIIIGSYKQLMSQALLHKDAKLFRRMGPARLQLALFRTHLMHRMEHYLTSMFRIGVVGSAQIY